MIRGPRGRNASIRRVLLVWKAVQGRRFRPPANELAQRFGVHFRTIYRDFALLEELHFAVPPPLPDNYHAAVGAEKARYSEKAAS